MIPRENDQSKAQDCYGVCLIAASICAPSTLPIILNIVCESNAVLCAALKFSETLCTYTSKSYGCGVS
jgi:hypothetical protein